MVRKFVSSMFSVVITCTLAGMVIASRKKASDDVEPDVQAAEESVTFTEADTDHPGTVSVGGTVTVVLYEDPSQNLKWVWVRDSVDLQDPFMVLVDESKKDPTPTQETRRFVFKALKAGVFYPVFSYGPYTHEIDRSIRSATFTVTVQ